MRPVSGLVVVLEQVAKRPEASSHLLQLYVCDSVSGSSSDRGARGGDRSHSEGGADESWEVREQQRLQRCTLSPLVWDALLVQCDATPAPAAPLA
mgnify:FL=1